MAGVFFCALASAADVHDNARQILASTGVRGGLIVHLGCGDGKLTAALRASDSYVVQGLDVNAAAMETARAHLRSLDLLGPVAVDRYDGTHLPYTDGLVKLLVASDRQKVPDQEMMRVLAPLGVAYIREGNAWKKTVKSWPAEIDEWTQYLHGPDNNAVARDTLVGPPRHMQWLAEPMWTRNHHRLNSISAVVTAQGRMLAICDDAPAADATLPGEWSIVARDAFSGVLLWRKPISAWASNQIRFRSGPSQVTRLLVAGGDRLYAPLGLSAPISELDAATGETLRTYDETSGAEECILAGNVLLVLKGSPVAEQAAGHELFKASFVQPNKKSIVALDTAAGKVLWSWSDTSLSVRPETLAADGRRAFIQVGEGIVCLDLKSGDKLWTYTAGVAQSPTRKSKKADARAPSPESRAPAEQSSAAKSNRQRASLTSYGSYTLVVSDGVVLCNLAGRLTAIAAEDGKWLWDCKAGAGFHSPADVFVIHGLVWQGQHERDSVAPPPVEDFNEARDLKTGEVRARNEILVDLQTSGHHHRCYREKATTRYLITSKRGMELMDLVGEGHSRNNWVRGTCQYGILPANGLLYAPPHSCGCYMESKLWGFWALAPERTSVADAMRAVSDAQRLEKGPAYGKPPLSRVDQGGAWPQYRHDVLRSGVSDTIVPAKIAQAWKTRVGGRLTQPVIAAGRVLVASVDQNTVYALDEVSGKVVWSYTVGGRVDSPPAVHKGRVLFGSADGRVYCLRLADGQLVWRFLAAPADLRAVACEQVESLWPVHGSVMVLDDVAYCAAGRSTWLDGGIDLYALSPATGAVLSKFRYQSQHPEFRQGKDQAKPEHQTRVEQNTTDYKTFLESDHSDAFSMTGGTTSDILVSDGREVFLHQARFSAKLQMQAAMARHLFSTSSLLDDTENHRSHWVLGSGDFSRLPVAYSWVVDRAEKGAELAVPTGVMMVFDKNTVWGIERKGDANGQYQIYARKTQPLGGQQEPLPDLRPLPKNVKSEMIWQVDLPVHARALLRSDERLIVGAQPLAASSMAKKTAHEASAPGMIWLLSTRDGAKLTEIALDSPPVWDGMAAAHRRLYVSTADGQVLCLGGKQ